MRLSLHQWPQHARAFPRAVRILPRQLHASLEAMPGGTFNLRFTLGRSARLSSKARACPRYEGSSFSTFLPTWLFCDSPAGGGKGHLTVVFICVSRAADDAELTLLHTPSARRTSPFKEAYSRLFTPLKNWGICPLVLNYRSALHIRYKSFIRHAICQKNFLRVVFHFLDGIP